MTDSHPRILHDLTATGDRRFSPFCWRTKLAFAQKGLDYATRPLRFVDIDALNPGGPRLTLPTLDEVARRVNDSWAIACYLEETYPDRPSLFPSGLEVARFVQGWTNTQVNPALLRVILLDVHDALDAESQACFRQNREARFGMTLEAFVADRPGALQRFRQTLQPIPGTSSRISPSSPAPRPPTPTTFPPAPSSGLTPSARATSWTPVTRSRSGSTG